MLYQDFREWLAEHSKGCTDHGNVMPAYILRTLDELITKHETKQPAGLHTQSQTAPKPAVNPVPPAAAPASTPAK